MIDLTRRTLPNTITVDGRAYSIYTDFRVWIRFEKDLFEHRSGNPFPVDYIFKNDRPTVCRINPLIAFARPETVVPRPTRASRQGVRVLDYAADGDYIYAAFVQQYGIDLIEVPELHWHKFLALLNGLKGTKLDEIMGYRCYEKQRNKDIDIYEELREAWALEEPLTAEEEAELEEFNRMLGGESEG